MNHRRRRRAPPWAKVLAAAAWDLITAARDVRERIRREERQLRSYVIAVRKLPDEPNKENGRSELQLLEELAQQKEPQGAK